jgi:hypothetical protein
MISKKVLFLTDLSSGDFPDKVEHLYVGEEFCDRRLPGTDELERFVCYLKKNSPGIKVTFVTPLITDFCFGRLKDILLFFSENRFVEEIVINDYGVLKFIKDNYDCFSLVCGRVLFSKALPQGELFKHGLSFNSNKVSFNNKARQSLNITFLNFLKGKGINRIECNNINDILKYGWQLKDSGFKVSLYYPFSYSAVTRYCYYNTSNKSNLRYGILPCLKQCRDKYVELKDRGKDFTFSLFGTSLVFQDERSSQICQKYYDRLIYFNPKLGYEGHDR